MRRYINQYRLAALFFLLSSVTVLCYQTSPPDDRINSILNEVRTLNQEVKNLKDAQKSWTDPSIASAITIALGGWIVTLIALWRTHKHQSQIKSESFIAALESFSGGTQNRSIGISIIEGNWDERKELRKVWVSILHSQAIYLLTQSENDKAHERDNLDRIMNLLESIKDDAQQLSPRQRTSLVDAVRNNRNPAGVTVAATKLKTWEQSFS